MWERDQLKKYIQNNILSPKGRFFKKTIEKYINLNIEFKENLFYHTNFLNSNTDLQTRVAYILNDIYESIKCPTCGKQIILENFLSMERTEYCSMKCSNIGRKGKKINNNLTHDQKISKIKNYIKYVLACKKFGYKLDLEFSYKLKLRSKIKLKCINCDKVYQILFSVFIRGTFKCSNCYKIKKYKEIKKIIEKRGGKLISSNIKDFNTKLIVQCKNNHIWKAKYGNLKRRHWCQKCAGLVPYTFEQIKKDIDKKGGILLTRKEDYVNVFTILKVKCKKCNSIWNPCFSNLINNSWCPICTKGKGENLVRETFEKLFNKKFPTKRPKWLTNPLTNCRLELDGYNEELKIAFEHQGRQHYEHIKHFHKTIEKFHYLQEKDQFKRNKCKEMSIALIEIPEMFYLTDPKDLEELIKSELQKHRITI